MYAGICQDVTCLSAIQEKKMIKKLNRQKTVSSTITNER
jgi:hypothetical protein